MIAWKEFNIYTVDPRMRDMGLDENETLVPVSIKTIEITDFYKSRNYDIGVDGVSVGLKNGQTYFLVIDYEEFKKFIHENTIE